MKNRIYRTINIQQEIHTKLKLLAHKNNDTIYNIVNNAIEKALLNNDKEFINISAENKQSYAIDADIFTKHKKYFVKNNISIKQLITHAVIATVK